MNIENKLSIGCTFLVEVFNEDGEVTYKGEPFHNTVLDCGLLSWWNNTLKSMISYINIGSSSVLPSSSQTGLLDRKFSTNNLFVGDSWISSPIPNKLYFGIRRTFQFNIGTCTGDFTEVGLSLSNNSSYLNRQLFKNSSGDPIVVRVLATEGLRLTVELKVYADTSIVPYSCAYKIDTKNATSGSIVISRLGVTRSISLETLLNDSVTTKNTIGQLVDIYSIAWCQQDPDYPGVVWLLFRSNSIVDPLLTMASNTFVGGSDSTTFENPIVFNRDVNHPPIEYDFEDITTPGNTGKLHYRKGLHFSDYSVTKPWSCDSYGNGNIVKMPISNLGFHLLTRMPTSSVFTVTPSLGNNICTRKNYYAPGNFTTGAAVSLTGGYTCYNNNSEWAGCFDFKLDEPITVSNTEEIEISMTFTWGRYIP